MRKLVKVLGGDAAVSDIVSGSVKATCGAVTTSLFRCRDRIATASQVLPGLQLEVLASVPVQQTLPHAGTTLQSMLVSIQQLHRMDICQRAHLTHCMQVNCLQNCFSQRMCVLQELYTFSDLTVRENLEYACRLRQPIRLSHYQVINPEHLEGLPIAS